MENVNAEASVIAKLGMLNVMRGRASNDPPAPDKLIIMNTKLLINNRFIGSMEL